MDGAARGTISDRNVAYGVHSDAPHPSARGVGSVGALLIDGRSPARISDFIPTNRSSPPVVDGVIDHECLVSAEIPVSQAMHQPVTETVELLRRARLRNAVPATTCLGVGGKGNQRWSGEG